VVWGAQAASLELNPELTPPMTAALEEVRSGVERELRRWGIEPSLS